MMADAVHEIREKFTPVLMRHGVRKAVLFGSYARGDAGESSDIDLLVDSGLYGLEFVGLIEDIREAAEKEVDVFDVLHIEKGSGMEKEIESTGVVIYEK